MHGNEQPKTYHGDRLPLAASFRSDLVIARQQTLLLADLILRQRPRLWGGLQASAAGSVPVALIYSFFVDQYAAGLTGGAVKG